MGSRDKEEQILVLSALLHDIGKLVQRGESDPKRSKHSEFGAEFVKNHLSLGEDPRSEIEEIVRAHHGERYGGNYPYLLSIVRRADALSANEREEEEEGDKRINVTPLLSVFSHINIGANSEGDRWDVYYPAYVLSRDNVVYPVDMGRASNSAEVYRKIKEGFAEELKDLHPDNKGGINTLLYVMQKYLQYIPSAVYKSVPDISLYDHLKTTAAIALCLYRSNTNRKFAFVMGDLSGIQDFIFKTLKGGEDKSVDEHATKRMRGRSAAIKLIIDSVVRYIVEEFDLYEFNVLWQGGGNFLIMLPNDDDLDKRMRKIRREVNDFLLRQFGDLYLNMVWGSYESIERFNEILGDLHRRMDEESKGRKYLDFVRSEDFYFGRHMDGQHLCPVCGLHPVDREGDICETCRMLENLGGRLVKARYMVREVGGSWRGDMVFRYGEFTITYTFESSADHLDGEVFSIDSFTLPPRGAVRGFKVIKTYVPVLDNKVLSVSEMIEIGDAKAKYGVFKADVDCLGEIFSRGLYGEDGNRVSISRVTMLSFLLDLFFTVEVNNIAKRHGVYIVFSGGDDLTAVGRYDNIVEFAMDVQEGFKRWIGNNPNFHLSAGIELFNEKFPIRRAVEIAEESLEKSKNPQGFIKRCVERGNRVTIFERVLEWDQLREQHKLARDLQDAYEKGYLSSSFSHFLLTLHRLSPGFYANKPLERGARIIPSPLPYLKYYFGRRKVNKEVEDLISRISGSDVFDNIPVAVSLWVLNRRYGKKVRGGEE